MTMHTEARELHLYAENESALYNQRQSIEGTFDNSKAAKLWMYWVDAAAKRYAKEHGSGTDWIKMFPKSAREEVARELVQEFIGAYKLGEFKHYIPKKYQPKPAKKTARRK